jgi:hypothetical protein
MYSFCGDGDIYLKKIMSNRKQELVICSNPECKKEFYKDSSEITRNNKIGRKNHCSLKCSGYSNHKHLKSYSNENKKYLEPGNLRDKYTGLREHYRRVKKRKHDYNITLDDLLDLWNEQNGICIYSGVKLVHPNNGGNNLNTASLDRIDSNLGYVKGNLQFISIICNQAKNNLSHKEMLEFIKKICDFNKDKF